jgi:hypothetical protein
MHVPKSFIKTRMFEIGRTVIHGQRKKVIELYHKKISWWLNIYGVRFKHYGYYIIFKKMCF